MKTLLAAAALSLVTGCGGAAASVVRGPKLDTMKQVQAALARGGHACKLDDEGDLVCDAERKDTSTLVVSFRSGAGGLHLSFLTAFHWKRPDVCPDVLKAVNTFNADAFSYHAACTKEGLVLVTMLVVPENGLTDRDVQAFVNWWGPTSSQLAFDSPMASELAK
jgi:putative sensory transduction regulator